LLVQNGADINAEDSLYNTPLRIALVEGFSATAEYIQSVGGVDRRSLSKSEEKMREQFRIRLNNL